MTTAHPTQPGEPRTCRVERSLYEAGCAINGLCNKEGTGHGRPWASTVTPSESRAAIRAMGTISDFLLDNLGQSH
jgi:hypothetical protein